MFQFPAFASFHLCVQWRMTDFWSAGFPHSEIHGSRPVWRLPVAYRSLLRPSSLADAQAFTVRPLLLNHRIVYDPIFELTRIRSSTMLLCFLRRISFT